MEKEVDKARQREMQRIVELADLYHVEHGRFPSRIRIGRALAARAFPRNPRMAVMPDFTVVQDDALQSEAHAFDAE